MPTPETARPLASLASPTSRAAIPTSEHPGAAASGAAGSGTAADAPRHDWTDGEIAAIHELPLTELVFRAQVAHRRHHDPTRVQLCTLLSIKTGGCPEDCGYCPQSAHYETGVERQGLLLKRGSIVDATIIGAPSSTKNQDGKRDPEMHQTAKGQQWYFGMRAHVGVDSRTKLIHTVLVSAANVADREALPYLLHGRETRVWGDQGYHGQSYLIHEHALHAKDFTNRRYRFNGRINGALD